MDKKEETILALSTAKKLYKNHCLNKCFCKSCEYYCATGNRIDCFESFFVKNYSKIVSESNTENSIFK